ncbi:hypothetical protein L218DRAFT_951288 [Marasmius fiardii PR-910]|nr:hypothetical protein L218DRAFT_951288 [Marasmius fiardii PR-910]
MASLPTVTFFPALTAGQDPVGAEKWPFYSLQSASVLVLITQSNQRFNVNPPRSEPQAVNPFSDIIISFSDCLFDHDLWLFFINWRTVDWGLFQIMLNHQIGHSLLLALISTSTIELARVCIRVRALTKRRRSEIFGDIYMDGTGYDDDDGAARLRDRSGSEFIKQYIKDGWTNQLSKKPRNGEPKWPI